jgi:hypothetical protein
MPEGAGLESGCWQLNRPETLEITGADAERQAPQRANDRAMTRDCAEPLIIVIGHYRRMCKRYGAHPRPRGN